MKIAIWSVVGLLFVVAAARYLWYRWLQKKAMSEGVVVYATVVSSTPIKRFGKYLPMVKIVMWIQEPDQPGREVTLSSRIEQGQRIDPGVRLPVVVDPKDPRRIYPADEDAAKRVVFTGSRSERRQMKSGRGVMQAPQGPGGYRGGPPRGSRGAR